MSFGDEIVPAMPPMSTRDLERLGVSLGLMLGLDFSEGPIQIDWPSLILTTLPQFGIHVSPVDPAEIDGDEGATDPSGTGPIDVLLRVDLFDALSDAGPRGNRARATMCHEFCHCVLHVPRIRRFRSHVSGQSLLRRARRAELKPYLDPEWQAWTLAGCVMVPRRVLEALLHLPVHVIAPQFGISVDFLRVHMSRLRLQQGMYARR